MLRKKMAKSKSLTKGGIYYLIYNGLNMAFPLITGIYVSRKLLPESIGAVAAAQNLAQYFVILAFLGIPTYGVREIAKNRDNKKETDKIYSELFVINLISTIVFLTLYILLVVVVPVYRKEISLYLIVGGSIALNAFNITWLYEGQEEFAFISVRNIIFKTLAFVLLVFFVRDEGDYLYYAGVTVAGTAGNCIVNMFYSSKFVKFSLRDLNLKRHMRSIIFLVAVNMAIEIYSLIDITMMNFICSKESIAYYKYAHNIQKMLLQLVNTFTIVLIPRISYYYKERKINDFNRMISKAFVIIFMASVPMIIGIYYTSDFLITKMYGNAYITSACLLKIFSVLILVSPVGYLLGSRVLLVTDHENLMIISVAIGACVNVAGNTVLIPLYAEYGAACASVISEFVVMGVYVFLGKEYYHLQGVIISLLKIMGAALAMGVYLFAVSRIIEEGWMLLLLEMLGGAVIYYLVLLYEREEIAVSYTKQIFAKMFH